MLLSNLQVVSTPLKLLFLYLTNALFIADCPKHFVHVNKNSFLSHTVYLGNI